MNENQNIPGESSPGKWPEPISQTQATPPLTSQPQQAMEVHHHGHVHEKKKWKEYLFQFLMLFLAVFFGFLAENLREHIEDNKKEKEYIKSLVVDLGIDRAMISNTREKIAEQIRGFDTLQTLFSSDLENNAQAVYDCYYFSSYLQLSFPVNFNERTITQLLSSGNMRLIKTSGVADRVTEYFNIVKDVDVQKQLYIDNINKCIESMYKIYDIANLRRRVNERDSLIFVRGDWSAIQLLSTEPADLKKFIATMEITKLIIHGYKLYLGIIDDQAEGLKEFLEKEYHLKSK